MLRVYRLLGGRPNPVVTTLPSQQAAPSSSAGQGALDLGDDIWDENLYVVGKDGQIRKILR